MTVNSTSESRTTLQEIKQQGPQEAAKHLGLGFMHHDQRERELAIEAFAVTDRFQFKHLDEDAVREASEAYVDALWEKDRIETACTVDGALDASALNDADWSPVREAFGRRASVVGMDPEYAKLSTVAWRRHKVGGDYWTPMKQAQVHEIRAALQDPEYPHKPRGGQSGHGPEAAQYALGVELHDTRRFEEMTNVMVPYFERIDRRHQRHNDEEWDVSESLGQ
ncbi:hypothetical protein EKH57_13510 [Halorubrum sp. BOL3-1]|uniref:hypothetical protein n=1 Tax=Halorubrum sp. BOL3-1 TaxID=2497325 RepID=UPI001004DB74|nr:hypothetical protein [Halorubrum sp. BOL3-1]QAU13653.1 hypothetical protein EKH57_13510 [Halorubrum sp. BOL3-1]